MRPTPTFPPGLGPRDRLLASGPAALSDRELICVLLGSGMQGLNVWDLSEKVLSAIDGSTASVTVKDLQAVHGVGAAKACLLTAALEFARRRIRPEGTKIRGPEDVLPLVQHLADRKQEHFICISLNGAHEVIANRTVTVGFVNFCQVHPREVFADPITDRATAIICAHNHPSGNLEPSREDIDLTRRLREAGDLLGIKLLDHVVFGKGGVRSVGAGK